ncbi:MAG: LysR family transcriptional regulator [Candidatus Binatia bacterium]
MELRHLRYFLVVAEELHFSRAADRRDIAQPPLSQMIRRLEHELGTPLFHRTKRRVSLTDAGFIFQEEAKRTLAQAERAVSRVRRASRGELGRLIVGFIGSATYSVLPPIIRRFREQYPEVDLTLQELSTVQQVRALREERLQVGFLRPFTPEPLLKSTMILQEPLMVALSEQHRLSRQAKISMRLLMNEPFILFPRSLAPELYDQIISLCQGARFSPHVVQEAMQLPTIISLVAAGIGLAVIPASLQNLGRAGVHYRAIRESTPKAELVVAWRAEQPSTLVQSFLRVATEQGKTGSVTENPL